MTEITKQVLGRGLSALLGSPQEEEGGGAELTSRELHVESIYPGSQQPRRSFPKEELQALCVSIQDKGVLQPILVRPHPIVPGYEIVAGERRWRAARQLDLKTIPAIIREFTNKEAFEVGLLENLQRQDLDPIDEAGGYRRLAEEFGHTQESLSRIVGKSRSHIANTLRLLTLPENVKDHLRTGTLSAGHGRAIVASEDPESLAELIIEKNLSVREAEALAKKGLIKKNSDSQPRTSDSERDVIRQQLSDFLGVPVNLILKGDGGKVEINFKNPDELDHILRQFNRMADSVYPPGFLN